MECPDIKRFHELLDENFTLYISNGDKISGFESFKNWINSNASKIKTSTHRYKNLEIINNNNIVKVEVDFDWKGIMVDNKKMIAETHHEWILSNDTENRFAKMKEMKVTEIKPFQIVDNFLKQ
jgi:trehalose-6-phosphatase